MPEQQEFVPLANGHVPDKVASSAPVELDSIFHHSGVNALAENQTLKLSPNLTVVYGDNAAGKTGYIRILKSACRARGHEKILGNVVSGAAPLAPDVAIKYKIGAETGLREWAKTNSFPVSACSIRNAPRSTSPRKLMSRSGPSGWTFSISW